MMDARSLAVLSRLEAEDARERRQGKDRRERLRQIAPDVGPFLHALVLAAHPQRILEIGTSGGYSTIWLATAARSVGATVTTLEIDPAKVRRAQSSITESGVSDVVTIVEGDAFAYLKGEPGAFQFVFLDAEKEDYEDYLDLVVGLLPAGGLLVADNLTSHAEELAGFRARAESHPQLASAIVVPIGRGELVAVKAVTDEPDYH